MIFNYFGKSQIDLENENDRDKFKQIILDDEIKASNNQNIINSNMFPNPVDNSIHIDNRVSNESEEDRRAEAA